MTLRVMTYNILRGGLPMPGAKPREEAIAEVIRSANPDIVALLECVGFEAPGAMENWAERLGLQYNILGVVAPYEDGYCYNVTVFSRFFCKKLLNCARNLSKPGVFLCGRTRLWAIWKSAICTFTLLTKMKELLKLR